MPSDSARPLGLGTLALHAGQQPDPTTGSRAMPIHQTTSYVFKSTEHAANLFALKEMGWIYTRLMNPTTDVFEQRMAALEGGIGALALSSGQQAITVALLEPGPLRFAHHLRRRPCTAAPSPCSPRPSSVWGSRSPSSTPPIRRSIARAVKPNTRAVYIESVANPKNDVLDFEAIADVAHKHGLPVVCDNTVLTPILLRPFDYGIDITIYSATKFIGGHGTSIGGVIVDSGKFDWTREPGQVAAVHPARRIVSRDGFPRSGRAVVLHHHLPHALAPRHGRGVEPVQQLPLPARAGDVAPADAAAQRERPGAGQAPGVASAGDLGQLSGPAFASGLQAGAEVPVQRRGGDPRLRHQGRSGGGAEVHRVGQAGLAPGQHRRRQDADHPSRLDHPQPADARRVGRAPA